MGAVWLLRVVWRMASLVATVFMHSVSSALQVILFLG